jgi:hypothetical protein
LRNGAGASPISPAEKLTLTLIEDQGIPRARGPYREQNV